MATKSTKSAKPAEPSLALPSLLLFASGAAALIYQVLWVKQLSRVVGVDVYAVTTAVSAFFGGLALGGVLFGRRADRLERPGRLYAWLELGVAVAGVGATLLLAQAAPWFAALENSTGRFAWVLPFVLVGLPATLMGGTVPVLVRAVTTSGGELAGIGGKLYAANTAGAIAGTLLTAFVLVPAFGVRGSAVVAGVFNLTAALGALVLVLRPRSRPRSEIPEDEDEGRERGRAGIDNGPSPYAFRLPLFLYALAGALALGYEVVWSQAVVQWTSTRPFAFAVVLATYLAGLVAGSAWYSRRATRAGDAWGQFGFFIAAAGAVALLELALLGGWLAPLQIKAATLAFHLTHQESFSMAARFVVAAGCVVLVPTFFLGAAFPAVLKLAAGPDRAGRDTGALLAANTLGGIAGTALTGFVLLPALGLERTLGVLAIAAAVVGIIAAWRAGKGWRFATFGCGAVAVLTSILLPPDHLAQQLAALRKGKLVFNEASPGGMVTIIEQQSGPNTFRRLYIAGVSNSGDAMTSQRYMRLQALLPLLVHRGEPKSALVIGLGTGITAGSLTAYPGLEHRVVAELLPAVVRGTAQFAGNYDAATNPRLERRVRDGRRELLRSDDRYDLITLEPPPPSAAGVVNLYSRDFYELAARRLNADGIVAQWLPLPTQTDADTRSLVRSFLDVFPHASLWSTELHEMLLVGSLSPLEVDVPRITRRFEQPEVRQALTEVGVATPAALLATWITDRAGLEAYAGDVPATTDDRPRIEYGRWVLKEDFLETFPAILSHQTLPPLRGDDAAFRAALDRERTTLGIFYEAGLAARAGDRAGWQRAMAQVMQRDPANPYYRWFAGAAGE